MQRADFPTLQALLPLSPTAGGSLAAFQSAPPQFLRPLHIGQPGNEMGSDSPSVQPFLASPRGLLTPRGLSRMSSFGATTPVDIIKEGLVHNRNELVLLFSRCVGGLRAAIHSHGGPMA